MKERFLLRCIASINLIFALTACSDASKKMSDLLEHVPSDAEVVFVGNIKAIVESSGGSIEESRLRLPSYVDDMIGRSDSELISFLELSGVDMDAFAFFGDTDESNIVTLFSLLDKDKFINAIEDERFREKDVEDGVSYYVKKVDDDYDIYSYIAVSGDYAYSISDVWEISDFDAMKKLRRSIEDSNDRPFADTKFCDFITNSNLAGGSIKIPADAKREFRRAGFGSEIDDLLEGVVCFNSEITDNSLNVKVKLLDVNGDEIDTSALYKHFDSTAKINPTALAYLGENDIMVCGVSMKDYDWDYYFDEFGEAVNMSRSDMAVLTIVKSYLEKFDGTILVGVGLTNGKESIYKLGLDDVEDDIMNELSFTVVMETKTGKAKGIINDLKSLLDAQGLYYENAESGFALKFPDWNASIYVKAENDMIIMSNSDIDARDGNATVDNIKFENYFAAAGLVLGKQNKLFEDFNLDEELEVSLTYDLAALEMTIDFMVESDGSKGLIETVANALIDDIIPEAERISERWIEYYDSRYDAVPYDSSDDSYYDWGEDSVAVVE